LNRELQERIKSLLADQDRLKAEHERMNQVRAAYNADKRALSERISELEEAVSLREADR
jgi:septal ring factor EnvC (AmiA/AmiB activator)